MWWGAQAGAHCLLRPWPTNKLVIVKGASAFLAVGGGNKSPSHDHRSFIPASPWRCEMCLERGGRVFGHRKFEDQ